MPNRTMETIRSTRHWNLTHAAQAGHFTPTGQEGGWYTPTDCHRPSINHDIGWSTTRKTDGWKRDSFWRLMMGSPRAAAARRNAFSLFFRVSCERDGGGKKMFDLFTITEWVGWWSRGEVSIVYCADVQQRVTCYLELQAAISRWLVCFFLFLFFCCDGARWKRFAFVPFHEFFSTILFLFTLRPNSHWCIIQRFPFENLLQNSTVHLVKVFYTCYLKAACRTAMEMKMCWPVTCCCCT